MAVQATDTTALASQISEALQAELAECSPEQTLWLALDGVLRPEAYQATDAEDNLELAMQRDSVLTVHIHHPQVDAVWNPRWLPLNLARAADSLLLQESIAHALEEIEPSRLEQGGGRRVSGWLVLSGEARSEAVRMAHLMIQRNAQGGTRLLRLHDPAVMWNVWALLTPGQQAQWLGLVGTWWLLDPAGNLVALRAHGDPSTEPMTQEQWVDVENITPLNAALRDWLPLVGTQDSLALERSRRVAVQALRRARMLGFNDFHDLSLFALHAITVHPEFDQHAVLRQLLDRRAPDEQYSSLVESLTVGDWLAVQTFNP